VFLLSPIFLKIKAWKSLLKDKVLVKSVTSEAEKLGSMTILKNIG